ESWRTIMPLTRTTRFVDRSPKDGSRYRLVAVNNLGDEFDVGEQALAPIRNLAAWPMPYRGGTMDISFRVEDSRGAPTPLQLEVLDIAGRRVHTIATGAYAPGLHHLQWNASAGARGALP